MAQADGGPGPVPNPNPPNPVETLLEAQLRTTSETVNLLAQALGQARLGGPPPVPLVVESLVRSCTEPSVVKSLSDDNYTTLESGWMAGCISHSHETKCC